MMGWCHTRAAKTTAKNRPYLTIICRAACPGQGRGGARARPAGAAHQAGAVCAPCARAGGVPEGAGGGGPGCLKGVLFLFWGGRALRCVAAARAAHTGVCGCRCLGGSCGRLQCCVVLQVGGSGPARWQAALTDLAIAPPLLLLHTGRPTLPTRAWAAPRQPSGARSWSSSRCGRDGFARQALLL